MAEAAAGGEKIARQKLTGRHAIVFLTCLMGILGPTAIIYTAAGLCYRPVSMHLGVQVSDVSLYITMVYLANLICAIPGARIFDKFDVRLVAAVCSVMVAVPYFCMSMFTEIWMWWIAGFIIGAGLVVVEFIVTNGILAKWFHTKFGFVIGLCFAMTGLGGVIYNLIGQMILGPDLEGWRDVYRIYGIICLVSTVPFQLLFLRRTPQEAGLLPYGYPLVGDAEELMEETQAENLPGFVRAEVLKMPIFWVFVIAGGLLNTITTLSQLFAVYAQWLANDGYGGAAIVALLALSGTLEAFASAGQGGGKVIIGAIESWNLKVALVVGAAGGVIGLLMIWQFPYRLGEGGIWPMWIGGLFYGLCYALSTACLPFMVREMFGSKDYDNIYSVFISIFNGIGAIGATGWAVVMQTGGWHVLYIAGIGVVLLLFAMLMTTAIVGDRNRRKAWYTPPVEFSSTGKVRDIPELVPLFQHADKEGRKLEDIYEEYLAKQAQ